MFQFMLERARTPLMAPKAAGGVSAKRPKAAALYPSFQGRSAASISTYQVIRLLENFCSDTNGGQN